MLSGIFFGLSENFFVCRKSTALAPPKNMGPTAPLIISVTTDTILARCKSSPQPPGENRVARSIALKK